MKSGISHRGFVSLKVEQPGEQCVSCMAAANGSCHGAHTAQNQKQIITVRCDAQGASWTAATAAITGIQFMKDCKMLVVASQDTSVGLWSTAGQLIGKCGQHTWTLNNQLTWQHSDASVSPLFPINVNLCLLHDISRIFLESENNNLKSEPSKAASGAMACPLHVPES